MNKHPEFFTFINHFNPHEHVESILLKKTSQSKELPIITIAIPTYKRANLLKEALDSALKQKYFDNYDVIVVDNNPERNDETELLINEYYKNNERLSYYKNAENIGMAGNWNRLYLLAKAEWVIMLHDDDILYNDYLDIMFNNIMRKHPEFDAYKPPMNEFNTLPVPERTKKNITYRNVKIHDLYRRNIIDVPSGLCMKKDIVIQCGGFDSEFYPASDYEMYIRILAKGYKFMLMNGSPLFLYRILQNDSMKIDVIKGFITQSKIIKNNILKDNHQIYKYLWNQHLQVSSMNIIKRSKKVFNKEADSLKGELQIKFTLLSYLIYYTIQIIVRTKEALTTKWIKL